MIELPGFYRGDDHTIRLIFTNANDGSAADIAGWELAASLKLSSELPDSEGVTSIYRAPDQVSDELKGMAFLNFTHEQTQNLIPTTYQLDVQRTNGGLVQTLLVARIKILSDVTRGA